MIKILISLCFLLLSACSNTNVQTSYYSINSNIITNVNNTCKNCKTTIVKIITPDFLETGSIGYYSNNKLVLSKNNIWTNDLNIMLQDTFVDLINSSNINNMLLFTQLTKPSGIDINNELKIKIKSFNGINDGFVEVSGNYVFSAEDGTIKQGSFNIKNKQENDGFEYLVDSLNKTWINICNNIIKDLF